MVNIIVKVTPDVKDLKPTVQKAIRDIENTPIKLTVDKGSLKEVNSSLKTTEKNVEAINNQLNKSGNLLNNFRQYLNTRVFNAIGTALKSALAEMKAIDTQMVTIQKVTKMSADDMDKLAVKANEVAKALGATASAYLDAVAAFSKAGYADQADELGELAIQTAKAGNTTQEIANQFLLAVDKAYQLNGEIKDLTTVLDGANEIGNKFATDVEHIAQGLGKVSSIASQAHVGINELTSAIGTITAVTQRSGNEAATALRALFLNIIGDTKTEIEDGARWTAGEIEGLRDVIKTYAKDAYDAAQATGSVIDPMEAIAGLAQSMKDGVLTEAKLMELVSDIGGKLRSSQLLALIQNFDMYQQMMETYANSAGSVAEEYAIYLDSWQAKTDQLKASWTEFVDGVLNTDTIKGAISSLANIIDALDSDIAKLVLTMTALGVSIRLVSSSTVGQLIPSITSLKDVVTLLTEAITANPLFAGALGAAALYGVYKLIVKYGDGLESVKKRVEELTEKVSKLKSEYEDLASRDDLNEQERTRLALLEKEIEYNEIILKQERKKAFNMQWGGNETRTSTTYTNLGGGNLQENETSDTRSKIDWAYADIQASQQKIAALKQSYIEATDAVSNFKSGTKEYADAIDKALAIETELNDEQEKYNRYLLDTTDSLNESRDVLSDEAKMLLSYLETLLGVDDALRDGNVSTKANAKLAKELTGEYKELEEALKGVKIYTDKDIYDGMAQGLSAVEKAMSEMSEQGYISLQTGVSLIEQYPELQGQLQLTESGYILTSEAVEGLIQKELSLYMTEKGAGSAAVVIANAESTKQDVVNATTNAIWEQVTAWQALGLVGVQYAGGGWSSMDGATENASNPAYRKMQDARDQAVKAGLMAWELLHKKTTGGGSGGGGGNNNQKPVDQYLEDLKKQISAEETKLTLMEKQGKSTEELNEKRRKIQELLHKEAEHLKKTGASQEEIDKLSIEWWNIQQDINDALEEAKKKLEEIAEDLRDELEDAVDKLLDDAKDARDEAIAQLDAQLDNLRAQNDAKNKANELDEKQNAILQARINLQNALNQRTVRYYNASTGQWEWGANASNVASAQDALDKAEQDLQKYQADKAKNALEAEIERRKQEINDTYDAIEEEWNKLLSSMEDPARSIAEILDDIAQNGTPEMQKQVQNIGILLGDLASYIAGITGTSIDGKTPMNLTSKNGSSSSVDYSKLMANAKTEDEFNHYANLRAQKIASQGIDLKGEGWKSNEMLYNEWLANHTYDGGGLLRGVGGIKATSANEMVLPPDITRAMLSPSLGGAMRNRLDELRYLYGVNGERLSAGSIDNRVGTQYNGNIYNMNGYTISEDKARTTTVYDFVRMSRSLSIYKNAN